MSALYLVASTTMADPQTAEGLRVSLSTADWVKIGLMALAQAFTFAAALWRFASRLTSMETKLDIAINTQLTEHDTRIARLEAPYFAQGNAPRSRGVGNPNPHVG